MTIVDKPGGVTPTNTQGTRQTSSEDKFGQNLQKSKARRGRPPMAEHERKERISISLDRPTLEKLRATGPGWQTKINELLAEVVENDERFSPSKSQKTNK